MAHKNLFDKFSFLIAEDQTTVFTSSIKDCKKKMIYFMKKKIYACTSILMKD